MPSYVNPEKCDGCKALDKTACQYICPNNLMVLNADLISAESTSINSVTLLNAGSGSDTFYVSSEGAEGGNLDGILGHLAPAFHQIVDLLEQSDVVPVDAVQLLYASHEFHDLDRHGSDQPDRGKRTGDGQEPADDGQGCTQPFE